MRINAYDQIQRLYQPQKIALKPKTDKISRPTDSVSISKTARDMQIANKALSETPDTRKDLVATLKEQVDNGTYNVTPESFASKLLENIELP